jgi:DNA/RNA endonuclease YhcR with UshA esterase domain
MKRQLVIIVATAAIALGAGVWITSCSLTDNGSPAVDAGTDADGDCDGDTTVYDLQQDLVAVNEVVTLCGLVVTAPTLVDAEAGDGTIVVQEPDGGPNSGIVLYMYGEILLAVPLEPGDVITVTGQYQEFYGLAEIAVTNADDLEVTGSADLPAPAIVDPASVATGGAEAEAYESVLIGVEGVTVTNDDMGYGQWQVDDALLVGDTYFAAAGGPSGDNISVATGDTFDAVHGILEFSYEEFKISPRDLDDYVGFSGGDTDTDADSDADVTIYDIQGGDVAADTGVILTDVVVTSPLIFDGSGFFVEEPEAGQFSGIYVHVWDPTGDPVSISVGDIVTLSGTYTEFYDLSEITIDGGSAVTPVGDGVAPEPEVIADPTTIATGGEDAEAYEGVLVTVSDVEVTTAVDGNGQIIVDDSLMVGSLFLDSFLSPAVGTTYASITGPLTYTYSDSKLLPRTLEDLVE